MKTNRPQSPPGSSASAVATAWDRLTALEPALADLERDVATAAARARGSRGHTNIDQIWHSRFKHRMTRLVGWQAQNPALQTEDAYHIAYNHLWRTLETSAYRRTTRTGV